VESEGGIAKMAVHPLAERKEMSAKANRLAKAITIAKEGIHSQTTDDYMVYIQTFSVVPERPANSREKSQEH
jgi:hypothetical protein